MKTRSLFPVLFLLFLFSGVSSAWWHIKDEKSRADLFFRLGDPEKDQIWIVNTQGKRYAFNFFLDEALPNSARFEINAGKLINYLEKSLKDSDYTTHLLTQLEDIKNSWPILDPEIPNSKHALLLIQQAIEYRSKEWKMQGETLRKRGEIRQSLDLSANIIYQRSRKMTKPVPKEIEKDSEKDSLPLPRPMARPYGYSSGIYDSGRPGTPAPVPSPYHYGYSSGYYDSGKPGTPAGPSPYGYGYSQGYGPLPGAQ